VRRLFREPEQKAASQMEDQAQEISIMTMGFPAQVQQTDDHSAHLQSLIGYIQRRIGTGERIAPEQGILFAQHAMQHFDALKKSDPAGAKQLAPVMQEIAQMGAAAVQAVQMQAQQAQQAQAQVSQSQPSQAPQPVSV
jgi:hypothetical protein